MRLVVACLLVLVVTRAAVAAPMFPDVPDMWAKDAVAALAAKGILEGYPDGTFKGDRAATRYEVAMVVARLLARMEQEHATFATRADLDDLRRLATQLREELDALGVRVGSLESNVTRLDKRVTELERITFYGSMDTRFASMRVWNRGLSQGVNEGPPIGILDPGAPFIPAVGVPLAFNPAQTGGDGRPTAVNPFLWNTASQFTFLFSGLPAPSYSNVVGSSFSNGGAGPFGFASTNPLIGLSDLIGAPPIVPAVLPTFDVESGRPWTNGVGWSGQGTLGLRIRLSEDIDSGLEFASYFTGGDTIVDSFYGVSAHRLANVFAADTNFVAAGALARDTGQALGNTPFTRMDIDNFWLIHKPSGIKVQLGAYGDIWTDDLVYVPEYNPNLWGPRYLDNYGFRVSGEGRLLGPVKWEVFGSTVASGNIISGFNLTGADYKPLLWGGDIEWSFLATDSDRARFKVNVLRIWDDNASGQPLTVGSNTAGLGVWLDWANPNGFYAAQLDPLGPVDPVGASKVAGQGSTSDVRPIIPGVAGNPQTARGTPNFGTDTGASGIFGQAFGFGIQFAGGVVLGGSTPAFGPQSMFTWGLSGGWDHVFSDDLKLRLLGEYGSSDYKPSQSSSYTAPDGQAWRLGAGLTLFRDWDVDSEYVTVNPYYNPYVLQYPQAGGVTQAYWRMPSFSWFPELYPVSDKETFPNNREGFRVFVKWNPRDAKDGQRKTAAWFEYGDMEQERTSLQSVRFSPGSISVGTPGDFSSSVPNGFVLGQLPGFIDTVFYGFHPTSFAEYTGSLLPSAVNQFATPLENPRGRVNNWGLGFKYRFDRLSGLQVRASYRDWEFRRPTSLAPAFGGSENNVLLDVDGGTVVLEYPVSERLSIKGGYSWTDVRGHYDPIGIYRNFAIDTGSTSFLTLSQTQTSPFLGFDYDIARNVSWNMTAKLLESDDHLGTFSTPNFFMSRNPFSWGGFQVTSQVKVTF